MTVNITSVKVVKIKFYREGRVLCVNMNSYLVKVAEPTSVKGAGYTLTCPLRMDLSLRNSHVVGAVGRIRAVMVGGVMGVRRGSYG